MLPSVTAKSIVARPSEWNSGAQICIVWPVPERHPTEQSADGGQRAALGGAAGGALGRPGRAAGEHREPRLDARREAAIRVGAPLGQRLERVRAGALGPGPPAAVRRVDAGQELGVLVVVDQQVRALALRDVAQLRAGEVGVEQDDPGAALRGREERLEEVAVVAAQDRDAVAGREAAVQPARSRWRWRCGRGRRR